jgi:hypothetical protein
MTPALYLAYAAATLAFCAARTGALVRSPMQIAWRERVAGAAQIAVGGMIAAMRRSA